MRCIVVNYVKFFYLDRQRQDRAQATFFYIKHEIVKDSPRAACKILLFYFLFWPFYFFVYFIINTSLKGAAKEIAVLPSHVRGVHRQATEGITRQAWHLKPRAAAHGFQHRCTIIIMINMKRV